jgi:hypothetical protein
MREKVDEVGRIQIAGVLYREDNATTIVVDTIWGF